MKEQQTRQRRARPALQAYLPAVFALVLILGHGATAQGQWATSGNNINSTNTGNVGIGTTNPSTAKLVISGTAGNTGLDLASTDQYAEMRLIRNSLGSADKDMYFQYMAGAGSRIHFFSNNSESMTLASGNLGVGTTSPARRLHVLGGSVESQYSTTTGQGYGFFISRDNNHFTENAYFDGQWKAIQAGKAAILETYTAGGYALYVQADDTSRAADAQRSFTVPFVVKTDGNVGIGTTNPQARLDVNGNVNITGNITATGNIAAKYQDVAEWVRSSQQLSAGTVVILDAERTNEVLACAKSYDTKVAGVVSAQPGIVLGEAGAGKVLVATTGRVKVRVDATRAPIHVGDLLVTSDVEGLAMKSTPVDLGGVQLHRPGTLIGKALEPLEKGTGEILVLLSLQ